MISFSHFIRGIMLSHSSYFSILSLSHLFLGFLGSYCILLHLKNAAVRIKHSASPTFFDLNNHEVSLKVRAWWKPIQAKWKVSVISQTCNPIIKGCKMAQRNSIRHYAAITSIKGAFWPYREHPDTAWHYSRQASLSFCSSSLCSLPSQLLPRIGIVL